MSLPSPQTRLMWSAHWLSSRRCAAMREHATVSMCTNPAEAQTVSVTGRPLGLGNRPDCVPSVAPRRRQRRCVPPHGPEQARRTAVEVDVRIRGGGAFWLVVSPFRAVDAMTKRVSSGYLATELSGAGGAKPVQ